MFCSQCGAKNTDEATFCSKCGNKLISEKTVSFFKPPPSVQINVDTVQPPINNVYASLKKVATSPVFLTGLIALGVYIFLMWTISGINSIIDLTTLSNIIEFFGAEGASSIGALANYGINRFVDISKVDILLSRLPHVVTLVGLCILFFMFKSYSNGALKITGLNILKYVQITSAFICGYSFLRFLIGCVDILKKDYILYEIYGLIVTLILLSPIFCAIQICFHFCAIKALNQITFTVLTGKAEKNIPPSLGYLCYVFGCFWSVIALFSNDSEKFLAYTAYAVSQFCFGSLLLSYITEMERLEIEEYSQKIKDFPFSVRPTGVTDLNKKYKGYFVKYLEHQLIVTNYDPDNADPKKDIQEEITIDKFENDVVFVINIFDSVNSSVENEVSYYVEVTSEHKLINEIDNYFASETKKQKKSTSFQKSRNLHAI